MPRSTLGDLGDEAPEPFALHAEDLMKVRQLAREKVAKEQYDKLFAAALEAAERDERIARGLAPKEGPTKAAQPVYRVVLSLPESITPIPALVVDGKAYWDGVAYELPEDHAKQLNEMQARAWENDDRMSKGREKDRRRAKPQVINGTTGVLNGPALVAIH